MALRKPEMWTVVLQRMPYLKNVEWKHVSKVGARTRARALGDLHNCHVSEDEFGRTYTVWTGDWYAPKDEAVMSESWRGE